MYCTDCGSKNPKDSKYCRECGKKILSLEDDARLSPSRASKVISLENVVPPDDPDRLRQLLDMAFWHNEVGNLNGALLACEAALKIDPNSTSALSLLGCLYEKQGKDERAIEIFERVVELNPESEADAAKLEHLLRGVRDRAVSPSLVHQLTPPVLLNASRRYPFLPPAAAVLAALVLLMIGTHYVWSRLQPATNGEPVSSLATISTQPTPHTGSTLSLTAPIATTAPSVGAPQPTLQQTPGTPTPSPAMAQDPFVAQRSGIMNEVPTVQDYSNRRSRSYEDVSSTPMPSEGNIKPLTVPPTDVPNHVVAVGQVPTQNDHVVMVGSNSAQNQSTQPSITEDSSDLPPPPASHIFITVHGSSASSNPEQSTPLPSDTRVRTISLRENAGASLQQKGLNLQDAGNYKAAEAAYQSAIAAYQQDIDNGRNSDEARRGIDACQVAVEICKQSQ